MKLLLEMNFNFVGNTLNFKRFQKFQEIRGTCSGKDYRLALTKGQTRIDYKDKEYLPVKNVQPYFLNKFKSSVSAGPGFALTAVPNIELDC